MARFDDGGGGGASFGSGLGKAVSGIAKSAKSVGKKSGRPRRSSGSGVSRGISGTRRGIEGVGQSVSRSAQRSQRSQRRSGSSRGNSGTGYRAASTPQISTPRPPVGNTPGGQIAASVPAPQPVSVEDFLAKDTAFRSQQSAYQKALADYAAQMQAEQGKYNGEFSAQQKQLGLDRQEGVTNLRDDYASRGLINSGVFGDALGDLNTKFDTSAADMERAKQAYMDDLMTGQTNFKTTQQTLLEKARQDALNRRLDTLKG